jgi:hypothetical protein
VSFSAPAFMKVLLQVPLRKVAARRYRAMALTLAYLGRAGVRPGSLSPMLRATMAPLSQATRARSRRFSSRVNDPHGSARQASSWP